MISIGDIHGDKLKNLFPNHVELQFNELNKAIHYGRKEGEKHFSFLGDLSENIRLSQEAECAFIRFFCYWDSKIELDVILGGFLRGIQVCVKNGSMLKAIKAYTRCLP